MKCCKNCFNDIYLKEYIEYNGSINSCSYCGKQNVKCIDIKALSELFEPLIELYDPAINVITIMEIKEFNSLEQKMIWELLQENWYIFSSDDSEVHGSLLSDMFRKSDPSEPEKYLFGEFWIDAYDYWGINTEYSDRLKDLWQKFKDDLISKNRFFPQNDIDLKRLEESLPYLENNDFKLGSKFSRARKCLDSKKYECKEMGKPPNKIVPAGRANPKGISYLYLGSDNDTAIAEIRPSFNELITVAKFICSKDIKLIDLRDMEIESPFKLGFYLKIFLVNLVFLRLLGIELTRPISPTDSELEYLPSQYICEFIKLKKYDGILYHSSVSKSGFNLVLFNDKNNVRCLETHLIQITDTKFSYKKWKP